MFEIDLSHTQGSPIMLVLLWRSPCFLPSESRASLCSGLSNSALATDLSPQVQDLLFKISSIGFSVFTGTDLSCSYSGDKEAGPYIHSLPWLTEVCQGQVGQLQETVSQYFKNALKVWVYIPVAEHLFGCVIPWVLSLA